MLYQIILCVNNDSYNITVVDCEKYNTSATRNVRFIKKYDKYNAWKLNSSLTISKQKFLEKYIKLINLQLYNYILPLFSVISDI